MSGYIGYRKVPTLANGGGIWGINEQAKFRKEGVWPMIEHHLYWRLYITATASTTCEIAEIEMRATAGGSDQCNGGTATAISTSASYYPSNAVDNSVSTFWHLGTNDMPAWWKYQFTGPVAVKQLLITARNPTYHALKNFELQWSDNNADWTAAGSWTNQSFTDGETKTFNV